jgi:L-rhamnose mutarotase
MRRYGMTICLKPEAEIAYKQHHRAVWPEVLSKITECNIRNYSIFLRDGVLFSYFEYSGEDFSAGHAENGRSPQDAGMVVNHESDADPSGVTSGR